MSPSPARSTLITSAPNHASSCVHVGPDCTWVKSRMRTPSNALPMLHPLVSSCLPVIASLDPGSPSAAGACGPSLVHRLVLGAGRVLVRVDPDVHDGRLARLRDHLA